MKVRELIEELGKVDPEAEVIYPSDQDDNFGASVDDVFESTRLVGLMLKDGPHEEKVVWLESSTHGL